MFTMQADNQFALQTVVVLISVNGYTVYDREVKTIQSFLDGLVLENCQ